MDAIEATYHDLPIAESASQTIEKENVHFDDAEATDEAVVAVEEGSSFEEVLSSMFEVALESQEDSAVEDNRDVTFLEMDVVDKDVDSILNTSANKFLEKNTKSEKVEFENNNTIFEGEETNLGDIPFVELELDVAEKGENLEGLQEVKYKNEKKKDENGEELQNEDKIGYVEENFTQNTTPLQQKKTENKQKVESKKEDKIEENKETEPLETRMTHKQKKVQTKKLPIVVEDLRTVEEARTGDAGSASFTEDSSSEDASSYYKSSSMGSSSTSESSSVQEGHGVQNEGQFASILAEQIKANSAELVERGKIVLRDGNVGEIRLQLKPAHLGSVRIQLKMSGDKKMQGEVTVSSKEAFDAFEESMQDLVASFNEAGFDASGFNLNWQGNKKEEIVREDLSNQYFSPEKTHLSLSERLGFADNMYGIDKARKLNVLA